jgi:hypothetical protein
VARTHEKFPDPGERACVDRSGRNRLLGCLGVLAVLAFPLQAAWALTPLTELFYAPDITVQIGFNGLIIEPSEVAAENNARTVRQVSSGALLGAAHVTGYHQLANGDQLFSFNIALKLPGGITARPGDVVRLEGTTYTLEFDASTNGIPPGVMTDAVSMIDNDLLLSFDTTVTLNQSTPNELTVDDEDLVRFDGSTFAMFFDGSAAGVPTALDLDGAHYLENGHLLLAFDGSGTVAGVTFNPNDVLEYDPVNGTWELAYDGSVRQPGWRAGTIGALYAVAQPPTPTPTSTLTATPMDTEPPTETTTPGPSATVTSTAEPSSTPAATLTATRSATETGTSTITHTATNTPSPTHTPSVTPTSASTATATPSATGTTSATPTDTAAATGSPPVATSTPTSIESVTPTPNGTATPTRTSEVPPCVGDCDENRVVTLSELADGVNAVLGLAEPGQCAALDRDHNGVVTVDELMAAVNAALNGCSPAGATPSASRS